MNKLKLKLRASIIFLILAISMLSPALAFDGTQRSESGDNTIVRNLIDNNGVEYTLTIRPLDEQSYITPRGAETQVEKSFNIGYSYGLGGDVGEYKYTVHGIVDNGDHLAYITSISYAVVSGATPKRSSFSSSENTGTITLWFKGPFATDETAWSSTFKITTSGIISVV